MLKSQWRRVLMAIRMLLSLAALGAFADASAAESILKIAHVRPRDSGADNDVRALTFEISQATGLKFKVFPDSSLGDYAAVQRKLSEGSVELALQPLSTDQDIRFQIANLPYLVRDWADAKAKFGRGGAVRKAVEALCEPQGIEVLAVYPQYFGGISFKKNPAIPDRSVLRVRSPKSRSHVLLTRALGYTPVELGFSDITRAFGADRIDGIVGSGAEGYYVSFLEHTRFYVVANTHFEAWYLLASKKRFDELAPRTRDEFRKAAAYFESHRWSRAETSQAFNELRLRNAGVQILRPSKEEAEKTAAQVRAQVWPTILDEIGRPYANRVLGLALAPALTR